MKKNLQPSQNLQIANKALNASTSPFIIAEMACAHQGKRDEAMALVDVAADARADAIQFEIFDADNNMSADFPNVELIRTLQLNAEDWQAVADHARKRDICIIAYVYDAPSYELGRTLQPDAYKLNASDLSNPELLSAVAGTGLPFTIGTGASSMEEIGESLDYLLARGGNQVVLMHGVQSFPTRVEDAQINRLGLLRNTFQTLTGYADHTDSADPAAILTDLMAVGAGAVILEKHICTKKGEERIDTQSALEPEDFKTYVRQIRQLAPAMGAQTPQPFTAAEIRYRQFQKKVAIAARTIEKDQTLQQEDIIYLRHPLEGLSPMRALTLLGRPAAKTIEAGKPLQEKHFSQS